MKKGTFYTTCMENGSLIAVERKGYILQKIYNGKFYYFGIDQRYKGYWYVTEMSTGYKITVANRLKYCENEVDKCLRGLERFFNDSQKASKAQENFQTAMLNLSKSQVENILGE